MIDFRGAISMDTALPQETGNDVQPLSSAYWFMQRPLFLIFRGEVR